MSVAVSAQGHAGPGPNRKWVFLLSGMHLRSIATPGALRVLFAHGENPSICTTSLQLRTPPNQRGSGGSSGTSVSGNEAEKAQESRAMRFPGSPVDKTPTQGAQVLSVAGKLDPIHPIQG